MRPPAAGFSTSRVMRAPGSSIVGDERQTSALADESIDARAARLLERFARHAVAEWRQLQIGLGPELPQRALVALLARRRHQTLVQRAQPLDERRARLAAQALRPRARRI